MSGPSTNHEMTRAQRMITRLLFPFAESIERHSRSWQVTCSCGYSKSVWERGGVRWLAAGKPRTWGKCSACSERTWHRIHQDD